MTTWEIARDGDEHLVIETHDTKVDGYQLREVVARCPSKVQAKFIADALQEVRGDA